MESMLTRHTIDKPECKLCKEENPMQNLAQDMLYSLFNPYHRDRGKFDLSEFLRRYVNEDFPMQRLSKSFFGNYWSRNLEKLGEMRKKAWEDLKQMLERGELGKDDISMSQLVELFFEEVVEELEKMGYIETSEGRFHRKTVRYKPIAEKIIGDKILSIALENLEKRKAGEEVTEMEGVSIFVTEKIVDFDETIHSLDNIDITESFVQSPKLEKFVARQPKHSEKCSYAMLIDVSDSMRGKKIVGAIEAAIALKRAIKRHDGELEIIAFNHRVSRVKGAEILNLEPRGRTDIGLALKFARKILAEKSGNRIVFLISDGEPTSSYNPQLTPWHCALKEAKMLRNINAKLQIVMFGNEKRFVDLCTSMAKLCGKSSVFHFSDPLNLKRYILHRF
ncbi:MAG: vWA domain-containing protein [Archaeoglobaceae archaeon]